MYLNMNIWALENVILNGPLWQADNRSLLSGAIFIYYILFIKVILV